MFDLTLSFDNGPDPEVTPTVIQTLAQRGIRTTFFVVGQKLEDPERRRVAARAHKEGHWIGNHTFTHSVPLGLQTEPNTADREIAPTERLIGSLAHPDRLFRPFGDGGNLSDGLLKRSVVDYLLRQNYTCVLWNAVPRDWIDPDGWVERAIEQCHLRPWTLMVLHDLPTGAMRHLDRFLDRAAASGGRFRQEFPPECVPIRAGSLTMPINGYVSDLQ